MNENFESLYPANARLDDLEKLAKYIKEGSSAQLVSIPGVGRSTVLGLLAHNKKVQLLHFSKENNIHFVLVNFQEVKQKSNHEVLKFIFLNLTESLRVDNSSEFQKVNLLFRDSLKTNDELILFQALKEALEHLIIEKKKKIVFLFDRFEEFVPSVTSEFFTNLKSLRSKFKYQFCCVFSVNRPLEDLVDESILSDFYEYIEGNYVYLELSDKVTTDFRVKYIEKITGKKLSEEMFSEITSQTGGVGRLVKLSVEVVLSKGISDVSNFLFGQKSIQAGLRDICKSLLPVEQQCLIKKDFDDKKAVDYLESVRVLKDKKIQIPLFSKHIDEHAKEDKKNEQKMIFSETTKEIVKGEKVISDQLTSSEYKLLSYLVKSPERVVSRDEIIEIVWSDVKSTAGITDQAVDQLIFRLRRKIEDDPNSPVHLETVKGRGFRFTP